MGKIRISRAALSVGLALLPACAHVPQADLSPEALLAQACEPGSRTTEISGSIWMKAKSPDASGQFPAEVQAIAPDRVRIEVTNLIGGSEAVVDVRGARYQIDVPGKGDRKAQRQQGRDSWGGIPLRWSSELFLGRIPCPSPDERRLARLELGASGELNVSLATGDSKQTYSYRFRNWSGRRWPEELTWRQVGGGSSREVRFKFDDPEDGTHSPRRWEAHSERGEVNVRWRDRHVQTPPNDVPNGIR